MYVEREMRVKLAALSKIVFGAPSAYMRMLDKGTYVPKVNSAGEKLYMEKKWHTPESLLTLMQDLAKQIEDARVRKI